MWFEQLTGFKENTPNEVRANLIVEGDTFISKANNRKMTFGELEICTLKHLQKTSPPREIFKDRIKVREVVGDVQFLHCQDENSKALFQAASQFNLLEMVHPDISPEQGIDRYERDYTQGPACAIACGAGTIFRNYFVKINDQIGQTSNTQIDCLELIGTELGNDKLNLWSMQNGYALPNQNGLLEINKIIAKLSISEREELKAKLKVGIQWNTEVTISAVKQKVSQIYCSALPVAYSTLDSIYWESFARIILEATYEATLHAALINYDKFGSNKVFLTLVGGGAFGNESHWIFESLERTLNKFRNTPLDILFVSYGQSNISLQKQVIEKYT